MKTNKSALKIFLKRKTIANLNLLIIDSNDTQMGISGDTCWNTCGC